MAKLTLQKLVWIRIWFWVTPLWWSKTILSRFLILGPFLYSVEGKYKYNKTVTVITPISPGSSTHIFPSSALLHSTQIITHLSGNTQDTQWNSGTYENIPLMYLLPKYSKIWPTSVLWPDPSFLASFKFRWRCQKNSTGMIGLHNFLKIFD